MGSFFWVLYSVESIAATLELLHQTLPHFLGIGQMFVDTQRENGRKVAVNWKAFAKKKIKKIKQNNWRVKLAWILLQSLADIYFMAWNKKAFFYIVLFVLGLDWTVEGLFMKGV